VTSRAWFLALTVALTAAAGSPAARNPVLLELFTSEGCSDCPPADRLLESLDRTQPVDGAELIVLSEHVDYWNRLGWQDPWSSAANSARQQQYGHWLRLPEVYTPQLVIDGTAQMVGSDAARIDAELRKAARQPKVPVTIAWRSGMLHVSAGPGGGTVYAAVADNLDKSQVARGENAGRSLTHTAVLRQFISLGGRSGGKPFAVDTALAATPGQRVIVFIQDAASGRILGVAQQRVTNSD